MKAVILAGGMGIRLRPFTFSIPKPLLPIGEKPILEIIIGRLKKFGFREFILAVGYKSKMLQAYIGDGRDLAVHIDYLPEKKPLGTAGFLSLLKEKYALRHDESFLLMYGAIMTRLNFLKMAQCHKKNNYEITVGIKVLQEKKPYGFVETKGNLVKEIIEKPSFSRVINAGIYMIKTSAIRQVPRNKFFTMPNLINRLIAGGYRVGAYNIKEYWLGLEELRHFEEIYNNKHIRQALIK